MKSWIGKIGSLLFALTVLYGTVGLSFSTHRCLSSGKSDSALFPELTGKSISCCGDEMGSLPAGSMSCASVEEPACCKTLHSYVNAAFSGFPVLEKKPLPVAAILFSMILPEVTFSRGTDIHPAVIPEEPSPPWSGRQMVYLLHQPKIPALLS
jgi:hypothetical protein